MALEEELDQYESRKDSFLEQEGKFVVIHGSEVAGFWETYEDALQVACLRFGLEPFLIKRIEFEERIHNIRGLPACPS